MTILAIDPGNEKSAWCVLQDGVPVAFAKEDNECVLPRLMNHKSWNGHWPQECCIEMVQCLGMAVGAEVFDTAWWTGRFTQAWISASDSQPRRIYRTDVKMHLCHTMRAKDSNIRQALIDRFGGNSKAIGGKKCLTCKGRKSVGRLFCPVCELRSQKNNDCRHCNGGKDKSVYCTQPCDECSETGWENPPGPLHGISADVWAALAVGITFLETHESR